MELKNYDSEFCGSLPLHLINQVQPYGILLVVDKKNLTVIQVSENLESITGLAPKNAVNRSIADFITSEQLKQLEEKFHTERKGKIPLRITLTVNDKAFDFLAIIHSKDEHLVFELEPLEDNKGQLFTDVYQEVKFAMSEIATADNLTDVCNKAITELKRLSGFDKIMVYRFDKHYNGEVIAEVMEDGFDSYLGLHFPASDVPKQARELYFKNPYRLIPFRDYTPVKLYPVINPTTGSFLDLSDCNLRSVAAVHVEYLKNMGVMASMSTAIIKDEKLWGLIACHHKEAKYLSYEVCSVFELMSGIISSRITALDNREQLQLGKQVQHIKSKLLEQVYLDDNPVTAMTDYDINILSLLDCTGAAIFYQKQVQTIGEVPGRYDIKDLVLWLQGQNIDKLYCTDNLAEQYENAISYSDKGSGIIVLPIHLEKGEYIIGFRPEVIQSVDWGGNPNEAIRFEANSVNYHPRNSFKQWKQTVQNTSLPWQKERVEVAESFRNFLIEYTLKKVYSML